MNLENPESINVYDFDKTVYDGDLKQCPTVLSYDISKEYDYPEKDDSRFCVILGDIRDIESMKMAMNNCDKLFIHLLLCRYTKKKI